MKPSRETLERAYNAHIKGGQNSWKYLTPAQKKKRRAKMEEGKRRKKLNRDKMD